MVDVRLNGDENHEVTVNVQDVAERAGKSSAFALSRMPFLQKIIAELAGTYFLIFAGCGSVVVNLANEKVITNPGIAIVWGLAVMVLVYSVGHISGAHFNPAVTIAFATCKRHPWKQVPPYVAAQVMGSILAAGTLRMMFEGQQDHHFSGTMPTGSDLQSFVIEFIITFYLMFVISGVSTDSRAVGELAGIAVGATVLLNVMMAGPVSGASMNPAGRIGPAVVSAKYKGLWIYILAPTLGAISGAWVYNIISGSQINHCPRAEITKSGSFLENSGRNGSF